MNGDVQSEDFNMTTRGARVFTLRGQVHHSEAAKLAAPWRRPIASIVSRGTERRQIGAVEQRTRPLGYMNVFLDSDSMEYSIAPVPHGAWTNGRHPRSITAPPGTSLAVAALSRFQLMTAVSLNTILPADRRTELSASVIGTGAVALGAVCELLRLGSESVVVYGRHRTENTQLPACVETRLLPLPTEHFDVVIDAAATDMAASIRSVKPGGLIGVLGTPTAGVPLSALEVHRKGLRVAGMHELLNYEQASYENLFRTLCRWAGRELPEFLTNSLVQPIRPHQYETFLYGKAHAQRPIGMFSW